METSLAPNRRPSSGLYFLPPPISTRGGQGIETLLMVCNADWYFVAHWLPLARQMRETARRIVVAAAEETGCRSVVEKEGVEFIPLNVQRRSTNPLTEIALGGRMFSLYRQIKPTLVHHITVKPVIYGSLAARFAGVPAVVNSITGLGYLFLKPGYGGRILNRMARSAYRLALHGKHTCTLFQNADDRQLFLSTGLVEPQNSFAFPGVGIDTDLFCPGSVAADPPIVLLAARMLRDKGVCEFVEAARTLQKQGVRCRMVLVGIPDKGNPATLDEAQLRQWQEEGTIEWWGYRDDMAAILQQSSVAVLPSYREGLPRFLQEAAGCGVPIVTTDVPGCRDVVTDGWNGFLVPPMDHRMLADRIGQLLTAEALRLQM
ncbi:MAG: glycosyltransferase family 4 protein, partial [bacterium]